MYLRVFFLKTWKYFYVPKVPLTEERSTVFLSSFVSHGAQSCRRARLWGHVPSALGDLGGLLVLWTSVSPNARKAVSRMSSLPTPCPQPEHPWLWGKSLVSPAQPRDLMGRHARTLIRAGRGVMGPVWLQRQTYKVGELLASDKL